MNLSHLANTKTATDIVFGAVSFAAVTQWLPLVLATPACIWFCIRIYEYFRHDRMGDD